MIIQIAFFILLPGLFVNVFSDIKQILTAIADQSFSFAGYMPQLLESFGVIALTILFGRFFCGWMCAFGSLSDIIHHISEKAFKVSFRINEKTDRILKHLKLVILAFIIIGIWIFGITGFNAANPWNVFGLLVSFSQAPDISHVFSEYTFGFFILLAIIIASFFIERFFCRYLCPLGALFTIISRLKTLKVRKPSDKCGNCRACTKSCAMGITMYKNTKIGSGECINCYKCIPACPRKNVSVVIAGEDIRPVAAGVIAVAVMTVACYSGSLASNVYGSSSESSETSSDPEQTTSKSIYKDGTWQGSAEGFRGTTTVAVTVDNDKITSIEVISFDDDYPYMKMAYNSIASQIINTQSTDADAVSGATFSSEGIMNAVDDALKKAKM